jgi:hypothetical protein
MPTAGAMSCSAYGGGGGGGPVQITRTRLSGRGPEYVTMFWSFSVVSVLSTVKINPFALSPIHSTTENRPF